MDNNRMIIHGHSTFTRGHIFWRMLNGPSQHTMNDATHQKQQQQLILAGFSNTLNSSI